MQVPPGPQVLAGKYQLIRELGRGSMGSVWYAEHLALRSPVAIKLIDPAIGTNQETLSRFLREARAAAALRSPHVVQILDFGVDNGVPFIAMEVLEGESLADRLARLRTLPPADVAWIMTHVARAIGRAEEAKIVHRDLKPGNIFIVKNGDEELAKVLDFGIAKRADGLGSSASNSTRPGIIVGTPYYMSPEQAQGASTVDHRTDIWAMGVIAFECLLGRRPFEGETVAGLLVAICGQPLPVPSQQGPVPQGFDDWFLRACARNVEERFSEARQCAAELSQICARPARATAPPMGAPRRKAILIAGSLAVLGAAGWGVHSLTSRASLEKDPAVVDQRARTANPPPESSSSQPEGMLALSQPGAPSAAPASAASIDAVHGAGKKTRKPGAPARRKVDLGI
jgi:serine/threonine-protein kinase